MSENNHLFDGLLGNAEREAVFCKIPDGENMRTITYADVVSISAQFANALVALGVEPGDRVAVQAPKSFEALMLYLATVRAGAVFLPLNTAYTVSEIEYFLDNATPSLFVCAPEQSQDYDALTERLDIRLESLGDWSSDNPDAGTLFAAASEASYEFENIEREANDLAAILYTSGTTGRSKGAMLSHDNLLSNAVSLVDYWQFTSDDVLIHALPIFHTHGLFVATNVILRSGASMILLPGFNADAIFMHMPAATTLMGVPTFYTRLLDDDRLQRSAVEHMRLFVSGSAPLLAETHIQFEDRTGHRILERYGMTETNMNTSNPYDGERRAGTVGFPLPGVEIRVANPETGEHLPDGEVGVLEVKGPNVFSGYWQMPEKTKEEFRDDGFFITGDLGLIDDQGYTQIVGRAKDLIISGGYNIYPKELELILDEQDGVLESAVIGVPHADFGEGVVAVLVPQKGTEIDIEALANALQDKIARFKQPKKLIVVDELPRNTMGKVQKNVLRDNYSNVLS
ncbi:MAG: malonyl-CoA synthase [Rhizobiaceae bacterium]|nr:malonyl-CoA synthase [Rhizobiaceae bacterium]